MADMAVDDADAALEEAPVEFNTNEFNTVCPIDVDVPKTPDISASSETVSALDKNDEVVSQTVRTEREGHCYWYIRLI